MKDNLKHWYYNGEPIGARSGRVMSACKQLVHYKNEVDLRNPTCSICKQIKKEFESDEMPTLSK